MDERGHETVAVDVDGEEYFGEFAPDFLPNHSDFNVEIPSFGHGDAAFAGQPMRPGIRLALTAAQANVVARLLVQLIGEGARMPEPPSLLAQYPEPRFMGEVLFRDGWTLVAHP